MTSNKARKVGLVTVVSLGVPWAAKRRLISNDRHGVIALCIPANYPSSFSKLQGLCNGVFAFKIGHKLTSNEARKLGLVTVVWAWTAQKEERRILIKLQNYRLLSGKHDHVEFKRVFWRLLVTYCLGKAKFEWRCRSHCLPVAQPVVPSRKPSASAPQHAASLSFIFWLTPKLGSFVSSARYDQ